MPESNKDSTPLQAHLCLDIDRVFGGTGEPYIFLDRDAWDKGLIVPTYSLYIFKNFFAVIFFRKTLILAKGKGPKSTDAVHLSGKGKRHYTTRQ
jgi:hypothetical protein